MITELILPAEDANIYEVTIGNWFYKEGDYVTSGASLVEIITDKAVFELESPVDAILKKIFVLEKSSVPPGIVLAVLGAEEDIIPSDIESRNNSILQQFQDEISAFFSA